jgi:HAD superfamily hydrolase (TIGR01509 family)
MKTEQKLIIFDFDGTIADSMWAWDELGRVTLEERGLPPLENYEAIIRTMSVPHFSEYLSKAYPSLAPAEELMAHWHEKMVYNYCNRVQLKAGIIELLDYLKAQGYLLYLASATHYKVLIQAVRHFDLEKYFDFIITEEVVGISKRDPKIYEMCVERSGCDLQHIYLFEDANHAVKTAKTLGVNVCGISDYSMRAHVDEVKSYSDIYMDDFTDMERIKAFLGE